MDDESDKALLARYRNGEKDAFAEIVIRYQRPIYNAAFWVLRNAEDARDVAQVVFLKVVERLDEYDSKYKFFSWIYRIAVNESLNLLRRNGHEDELDDDTQIAASDSANPEWQFGEAERSQQIQRALMSMSTRDRTVLVLRHFSECSYQEIADVLDIDEKTVKSRLYEARQHLGNLLQHLRPRT